MVRDGNVDLWGIVENAEQKNAIRLAAEVTPGVVSVADNIQIHPPRMSSGI
jgi:osmotically-inducible protein OsmY